ncbi:hypothetical protein [Streptomyces iconiensis]|uniref:PH domain-containing protein n=1 Tax=Streptomyces iconiensis TaxID=1384038 RepID=A0ABT7A344_9ACTN|nr:hypothetical protein [Streptomyces iconiensis]MDJ1135750.1 hypothetical protein [Streptomyces iconiensis]
MAVSLAFVPFARHIWCSRIVLDSGALMVVNPVRVYRVPYQDVVRVTATSGGTLLVVTSGRMEIPSTGFGGSVIDAFAGSTNTATDTAEHEVRRRRGSSDTEPGTVRFSREFVGDMCLVASLACLVIHVAGGR